MEGQRNTGGQEPGKVYRFKVRKKVIGKGTDVSGRYTFTRFINETFAEKVESICTCSREKIP